MILNMRPLGLDFGDNLDSGVPSDFNLEDELASAIDPFAWMTEPSEAAKAHE